MYKNTQFTYGSVAKLFHWLIFFLVLFMFFLGYFMDDVSGKVARAAVINIHKLTGLSILVLMFMRLAWALFNPKPIVPSAQLWERILERAGHFLLYFVLVLMPLAGWLMSSAAGRPPHFFNLHFKLPVPQSESLSDFFATTHNTLAIIIIVLVSLHVLAALYHHFVKKDNVLERILPEKSNM